LPSYISILDLIILPFILGAVYLFAYLYRAKKYPKGHPLRSYFLSSLTAKIIGAIIICLIYQYYYGYGDTFGYFNDARNLNKILLESPVDWVKLLFHSQNYPNFGNYSYFTESGSYTMPSNFIVVQFASVLGLFTLTTFIPTAILFAALSFSGIWALYVSFVKLFPKNYKTLSIPILFFPSVIIWGSAIFKDTLCIMALGWLTYTSIELFLKKRLKVFNIVFLAFSLYILTITKIYILAAFIPAFLFWLVNLNAARIRSPFLRIIAKLFSVIVVVAAFIFAWEGVNKYLNQYSVENIRETSENLRTTLQAISEESGGSGYDLGPIENTPLGLLKKMPAAVNVTLFRPYLWEVQNALMLINALESLVLLLFTIWLFIIRLKITNGLKVIFNDKTAQFCLIFTLIFAFAIGISTFNFGSLSRYRIPCLPFYGIFLSILYTSKYNYNN